VDSFTLDSRTNLILKEGGDVMKRGRASLLIPLGCHHRWNPRANQRREEREGEREAKEQRLVRAMVTVRRERWARELVRKGTRKGKSFRPLPDEETRTGPENGRGSNAERLAQAR
jgi:hypothetical protein